MVPKRIIMGYFCGIFLTESTINYLVYGKISYYNSNLWVSAKQILDYANQNWHTIFEEVSPPIVTAIVSQIVNETTKLFNQIPIDDLALD